MWLILAFEIQYFEFDPLPEPEPEP